MVFKKTSHYQKSFHVTYYRDKKNRHIETHLVTTYWFLFIPIYRIYKIESSNI
jgi:hypothetical protein